MTFTPNALFKLERHDAALKLALAAFFVYWLCMLPATFGQEQAGAAAVRVLALPAMLLMYWIASLKTTQMAQAFAVLGQMLAPKLFQRALMREKLTFIMLAWAFLATGMTLQLGLPQSRVSALTGAALVSAAACLGMLRSLSKTRMLAVPFARLLDAAPYLAPIALILLDLNAQLDRFGTLPAPLLVLLGLSFPCLALWLAQRCNTALPDFRWSALAAPASIAGWLSGHARHLTVLTWRSGQPFQDGHSSHIAPVVMRFAVVILPFMISRPVWVNGAVSLYGVMTLLVMSMLIAGGLVAREPHWRSFLVPGGMRPRRIGNHILAWTLGIQFGMVLCYTALFPIMAWFKQKSPGAAIDAQLVGSALMLAEFLFATTLAMVLRAALPSIRMWATVAGGFVILLMYPFFSRLAHLPKSVALTLPVYMLALVVAGALLLVLANRRWTPEKLFTEAGRGAPG